MKEKLTKKQEKVLTFIKNFSRDTGYPPTIREIAGRLGLTGPKAVQKHLGALERKGHIKRAAKKPRAIRLVDNINGLPIIGTVAAGRPIISEENIEGVFSLDFALNNKNYFFIKVKGDSMIDAYINEGDLALVKSQSTAENNDIVVAMVNGETTLKRFFRKEGAVILRPENRSMSPITVKGGDFKIIGKVVMIVRKI